ncbi:protein trichome birefringence-like 34 isoform X1 [Dioscorea cayenensis subsp. rotundata]|uniref:Protein trichome birefringence-like 34 isoform X1 n=1 Tax=Dioscorea cayennensis subsp. rotundata TaxID=55577 RepID=A0AB40CYY5_DIOCR|nr:protein trichome birefringence-like 34 isoform X1 [Dioscorea cayenensis subsp. rotundata]
MAKKPHHLAFHWAWGLRAHFNSLIAIVAVFALILTLSLTAINAPKPVLSTPRNSSSIEKTISAPKPVLSTLRNSSSTEKCNLFSGRWVYDDSSTHPLYSGLLCPYIHDEIGCDKYGRNDTSYQKWKWQPNQCNLPSFNSTKLLERLRDKRMVFVGDSLNRNQWVSMVCLLESSIPVYEKSMNYNGSTLSFNAKKYNATVDFYWAPLLLESNCDDPVKHRVSNRMFRAGAVETHARHYANADILIFNSYLWWKKPRMKMKILHGSFDDKVQVYDEVEMIKGFEIALKTWSQWLQDNVRLHKKELYFMSLSPTHAWGESLGEDSFQNCYNETQPIRNVNYNGRGQDFDIMQIAGSVINQLQRKGVNIQFLNITHLSEFRKDGHPSIYRKFWDTLSEEQLANPSSYSDCTHWCLPGVPDVWNELLYAHIFSKHAEE